MKSVNPATGDTMAIHEEMEEGAIDAVQGGAVEAFGRWRLSRMDERVALLERLADVYSANRDRLARMATAEMGKTLKPG